MADESQQPTSEALKQIRKRAKKAADDAANAVERVQVDMAGGFRADLKRLMKEHGFNNQQEIYQNLLRNVIAADVETAAWMLRCVTTPYAPSEKVSRAFHDQSLVELRRDPGDEVLSPNQSSISCQQPPRNLC
ncbi:hypothetical protein [Pseudomonas sp. CLCA07]